MTMHTEDALTRLLQGNQRYAATQQMYPRQTVVHRQLLVNGQTPFAAILSCSDSRVPSELIFDQGLGDLFIVRTAGHTVNDLVLASLEYAVYALHVPLVMVLGHLLCGAVTAVLEKQDLPGHMHELTEHIQPALAGLPAPPKTTVEQAVHANSRYTATSLARQSTVLSEAVAQKRLRMVAAFYDLRTGLVSVLN